jgi:NAD(P)-dependent dehydrogenase (short-subunit alcohol dehydrogenase family)
MKEFAGQTAVVTGAASGIGLALAQLFLERGMNVVLSDVEGAALTRVVEQLDESPGTPLSVVCDVADAASVDALADAAYQQFGSVQILCNNAGVFVGGASWENSVADYQWVFGVNVMGIANGARSFIPRMIEQGDDCHIVNTASMAGLTTLPFSSVYCMTKAAALHLSECMHKELESVAPQIGVSVLCPELINTGIATARRNRPEKYSQEGDLVETEFSKMIEDAAVETVATGLPPRAMAERVIIGIEQRKFYLLAEDYWKDIAFVRMDEIRKEENPTLDFPEGTI